MNQQCVSCGCPVADNTWHCGWCWANDPVLRPIHEANLRKRSLRDAPPTYEEET
jgi:hypothetical protein